MMSMIVYDVLKRRYMFINVIRLSFIPAVPKLWGALPSGGVSQVVNNDFTYSYIVRLYIIRGFSRKSLRLASVIALSITQYYRVYRTIQIFVYWNTIHFLYIYSREAQLLFLFLGWHEPKQFGNHWFILPPLPFITDQIWIHKIACHCLDYTWSKGLRELSLWQQLD